MTKVSVIVPVYNPGHDIDDCIRSLVFDQSLPSDEYEVIFVDDGSTDETPGRLDDLAAEHDHVRVEHIPNSGWPGRPRNVGVDLARGDYVYFVDNDDWVGPEALERLYEMAIREDADIVIGKVVGHGKYVPRGLFHRNRGDLGLFNSDRQTFALLGLLAPHKLFRKSLLTDHGIRFPEGRRRLEDHVFVVHAYFHAKVIAALADYPCYHWVLRDDRTNASATPFDPAGYYANVREVLDIVERHTEPGPWRDVIMSHWYRGKMLKRMGGAYLLTRPPEYGESLYAEVRALALERFGSNHEALLPFNLRLRSRLLRDGSRESLEALAMYESRLKGGVVSVGVSRDENTLSLELEAHLETENELLTFRRDGDRLVWAGPETVVRDLPEDVLTTTADVPDTRVQLLLRRPSDDVEFVLPSHTEVALRPGDDASRVVPVARATADLDPDVAAARAPLPPGRWHLYAVVTVAGFQSTVRARSRNGTPLIFRVTPDGRVRRLHRKKPRPSLAQRVAQRIGLARR